MNERLFSELLVAVVDNRGKTCPTTESGIPLIATNCIGNSHLYPSYEKARYVSDETYNNWFRGHPEPGDLIFVTKGTPGRVCLAPNPVDFCIAQDMVAARANPAEVYPPYLFAALRSTPVQRRIEQMHVGSLIPHFKKGDFDKLLIPVPDPSAQVFIGDLYSAMSRKIEVNRRMNETLEEMARAIFKSWFVDFDPVKARAEGRQPVGMDAEITVLFPDSMENSELGPIPAGWQIKMLPELALIVDCSHAKKPDRAKEGAVLLQLNNVGDDGAMKFEEEFCISSDEYQSRIKRMEITDGDIVVTKTGRVGAVAQAPPELKAAMGRNMVGVRSREGLMSPAYLREAMRSSAMNREMQKNTNDGTILRSLHVKAINRLKLLYPGLDLVHAAERHLRPMHLKMFDNNTESLILTELRDTLLPRLIRGQLRISDAEKALAEAPV